MSIFSSLRAQLSVLVSGTSAAISRVFSLGGRPEVYPDINSKTAISQGFNYNTAVYSIVMKYARKFGSISRYVYDSNMYEEKALAGKVVKPTSQAQRLMMYKTLMDNRSKKAYTPFSDKQVGMTPSLTELLNRPNP